MARPVFGPIDWETVAVSLVVALVVAVVTAILAERSNQRSFRREKLYELKLEAYLDLFSAFDMYIDAMDIMSGRVVGALADGLKEYLEGRGVSAADASAAASGLAAALGPTVQAAQWSALGYTLPGVLPPLPANNAGPPASGSPPGPSVDQAAQAAVPFFAVMSEASRRLNRAYARITLLGVPAEVNQAVGRLFKKLSRSGVAGGVLLASGPVADRQKLIQGWRNELVKLGEQLATDLSKTMR